MALTPATERLGLALNEAWLSTPDDAFGPDIPRIADALIQRPDALGLFAHLAFEQLHFRLALASVHIAERFAQARDALEHATAQAAGLGHDPHDPAA